MFDLISYKTRSGRVAARTDAQARLAEEAITRRAREARRTSREAKRIGLKRNIPGFKQPI